MEKPKNQIPVACFAPALTDEKLERYRSLIASEPAGEVRDALDSLLRCVDAWWELPESRRTDGEQFQTLRAGKRLTYSITPLEADHAAAIEQATPWMRELDSLSNVAGTGPLDSLKGELRDAAFHLLWHAKELTLDREPMTDDKIGA